MFFTCHQFPSVSEPTVLRVIASQFKFHAYAAIRPEYKIYRNFRDLLKRAKYIRHINVKDARRPLDCRNTYAINFKLELHWYIKILEISLDILQEKKLPHRNTINHINIDRDREKDIANQCNQYKKRFFVTIAKSCLLVHVHVKLETLML